MAVNWFCGLLAAVLFLGSEELYFSKTTPFSLESLSRESNAEISIPSMLTLACFKFGNESTSFSNNNFTFA